MDGELGSEVDRQTMQYKWNVLVSCVIYLIFGRSSLKEFHPIDKIVCKLS